MLFNITNTVYFVMLLFRFNLVLIGSSNCGSSCDTCIFRNLKQKNRSVESRVSDSILKGRFTFFHHDIRMFSQLNLLKKNYYN